MLNVFTTLTPKKLREALDLRRGSGEVRDIRALRGAAAGVLHCWTVAALQRDCTEPHEYKAGGFWKGACGPPRVNNENTSGWDSSSL